MAEEASAAVDIGRQQRGTSGVGQHHRRHPRRGDRRTEQQHGDRGGSQRTAKAGRDKPPAGAAGRLDRSGRTDRTTRAATVTLAEPDKQAVLVWQPGDAATRRALAVLRVKGETVEAVVDLETMQIESWRTVPGAQTAIRSDEWARAQATVKADPRWQAAMRARGYDAFDDIFCESLSAGFFGLPGEAGRRLLKMPCYDVAGAGSNVYARPTGASPSMAGSSPGTAGRSTWASIRASARSCRW